MTSNAADSHPAAADVSNDGPAKLVRRLERLPKTAVFLTVLAVTVAILMAPGTFGAVFTLVLAALSGFLIYITWPRNTARATRFARVVVVLALTTLGILKFFI